MQEIISFRVAIKALWFSDHDLGSAFKILSFSFSFLISSVQLEATVSQYGLLSDCHFSKSQSQQPLSPQGNCFSRHPSQSITGDNLIHHDVTAHYMLLLLTSYFSVVPQHSIQVQAYDQTNPRIPLWRINCLGSVLVSNIESVRFKSGGKKAH